MLLRVPISHVARLCVSGSTLAEQWHMPNVAFALGDDVVVATANQLLAMPLLVLMARLCPEGAEGTTFALVTSVQVRSLWAHARILARAYRTPPSASRRTPRPRPARASSTRRLASWLALCAA